MMSCLLRPWERQAVAPERAIKAMTVKMPDPRPAPRTTSSASYPHTHASPADSDMESSPRSFILPDLFSYCRYPLGMNVHCASVARASEKWLLKDANFTVRRQAAFRRLHAGELAAMCYPNADATRLRDVADFLNLLFTLDDWSDEFTDQDTVGLAGSVMSAFRDPEAFDTQKAAGKLAKRSVELLRC